MFLYFCIAPDVGGKQGVCGIKAKRQCKENISDCRGNIGGFTNWLSLTVQGF